MKIDDNFFMFQIVIECFVEVVGCSSLPITKVVCDNEVYEKTVCLFKSKVPNWFPQ